MTDEHELQLTLKRIGDSSLALSKARSDLAARGRRDAATLAVTRPTKIDSKPTRPDIATFQSWEEYHSERNQYETEFEAWLIAETRRIVRQELTAVQGETQIRVRHPWKVRPEDFLKQTWITSRECRSTKPDIETFPGTWGEYQSQYETEFENWMIAITGRTVREELTAVQRETQTTGPTKIYSKPTRPYLETFSGTWGEYHAEMSQYETEFEAWLIAETRRIVRQELTAVQRETQTKG